MNYFLVAPRLDLSLELPVSDELARAFEGQWARMHNQSMRDAFAEGLAKKLSELLMVQVDWDLRPPTPSQLAYAMAISKGLKIPLPVETTHYRGAIYEFLSAHSETFKATKTSKKVEESATTTTQGVGRGAELLSATPTPGALA